MSLPAGGPASGGEPQPLSQFVLKVHGRCDLSCDHCYVYEHADQSWRTKPRAMAPAVLRAAAGRIAEHASAWGLPQVRVVLHGGEPLLVGIARMDEILTDLRSRVEPVTRLDLIMQTNGVRLTPAMCDVLKRHGVRVGVSLDGDRAANDLHRRFANGAGSYDEVRAALALLRTPPYREIYAGILCTVDVRNDPVRVYEALLAEIPPQVDFLLPHATWDEPPLRPVGDHTPYASWLSAIHQRWLADDRPMRIRLFDGLRSTAEGGSSGSEQLGAGSVDMAVIETDGSFEQADSIKITYDGAPATGMNVLTHSVDDLSRLAPIAARLSGASGLSVICRSCPVVGQCGGGLYAHRFRTGSGFDNPSVFCADLRALVERTNQEREMHAAGSKPDDTGSSVAGLVAEIASGFGAEATVGRLADQQLSVTRALLFAVIDQHGDTAAWDALAAVEAVDPRAVERVLVHPYARAWAVDQLRADAAPSRLPYLGGLAAAAAVHAGVAVEVDVEIHRGVVALPTVGTAYWPTPITGPARLKVEPHRLWIIGADRTLAVDLTCPTEAGWWQPARSIVLADWSIRLEDGDPARDCHRWKPSTRLDADAERDWRTALAAAWRLIVTELPDYAPGLRAGLRVVVPLEPDPGGAQRASTARDAFGSVAAALTDPVDLAVLLVHEFQHGKLGALLDLCDLFDADSDELVAVAWKSELRPVEAALQGVYAHAAVADAWRRLAGRDPRGPELHAKYRGWTTDAIGALRKTDALTPLGVHFVDRLAASVEGWDS